MSGVRRRTRFDPSGLASTTPSSPHVFPKGFAPVTLRQVFFSGGFLFVLGWVLWSNDVDDKHKRHRAYFDTTRAVHLDKNAGKIASCVHNPLMTAPRPEMANAYRALYPFPEYQATCRGGDEEVPEYMIERDTEFHSRFKDLYFLAKRGLLDRLLFSTWEYRWDYNRELFRHDRRPNPSPHGDASQGHSHFQHHHQQQRSAPAAPHSDRTLRVFSIGSSSSAFALSSSSSRGGDGGYDSGLALIAYQALAAQEPSAESVDAAQKFILGSSLDRRNRGEEEHLSREGVVVKGGGVGRWGTGWDEVDLDLVSSTKQLLFNFRPVGDVLEASRVECSDEVLEHPVVVDPNPAATGAALLLPFHSQARLQAEPLAVDSLQVALCFVRELLSSDIRLAFDSGAIDAFPPLSPDAIAAAAAPTPPASALAFSPSSSSTYARLHFRVWPVDDLLLDAHKMHSHAHDTWRWRWEWLTSKLVFRQSSKNQGEEDPRSQQQTAGGKNQADATSSSPSPLLALLDLVRGRSASSSPPPKGTKVTSARAAAVGGSGGPAASVAVGQEGKPMLGTSKLVSSRSSSSSGAATSSPTGPTTTKTTMRLPIDHARKRSLGVHPRLGLEVFAVGAGFGPDNGGGSGGGKYPAPAVAFPVHKASAPVLAYALSQCASFVSSRGLSYSLLIGADWAYLWPRSSATAAVGVEAGVGVRGEGVGLSAASSSTIATTATALLAAESLAGVLKVESDTELASLTPAAAAAALALGSPSATELQIIFAQCAGNSDQPY